MSGSIEEIACGVASQYANEVDRQARFPTETFDALKSIGALSAGVPEDLGGAGCRVTQLSACCHVLAQHCASSAMILAMHYIQVECLVRHAGHVPEFRDYLSTLCDEQRLIASATSEVGTDGDMRRSLCAIEPDGTRFSLVKRATTISYAERADDLLLTARKSPSAAETDQIFVLAKKGEFSLTETGTWDTLGMRGTCSPPATVHTACDSWQVLPASSATILSHSMVPVSHILWSSVWLGIAKDAIARVRNHTRKKASETGDLGATTTRLERLDRQFRSLEFELREVTRWYEQLLAGGKEISVFNVDFSLALNNLKLNISDGSVDLVSGALRAIGINAYRNGCEMSIGRQLRDVMSAPLMINNDRLTQYNADLQMSLRRS